MRKTLLVTLTAISAAFCADLVTYVGTTGNERFYGACALTDGTVLVCGKAANLDWVPSGVARIPLSATAANGSSVPATDTADPNQGAISFIVRFNSDLTQMQKVYHFPSGTGGAITRIQTNSVPGAATGDVFISGRWTNAADATPNFCWVGKLDNNFVNGDPTRPLWVWKWYVNQPENFNYNLWDVGNDGKVVFYSYKNPSAGAWGAIYRLRADGSSLDSVPNWWNHNPMCVSLKPGNFDMRSKTQADYDLVTSHSGKGKKKGKYPHDFYFAGPQGINDNAGGYTGYQSDGKPATSVGIAVDRRDNTMYIGFNTPCANNTHDFEPTIMRMEPNGAITWYSHMYDEWTDDDNDGVVDAGETHQCPPDQYVDGVAIDYSKPVSAPEIIVLARSHGNAPQNYWSGTNSFHNQFTGTNGNEHLCWLGRFKGLNGDFVNASWNAEYDPWGGSFGPAYSDPILDGWPDHNQGWPSLKTTRTHSVACDLAGNVYLVATSRGPVTTSNAFQKAPNPLSGVYGCWTDFVRVFAGDFSTLRYCSMLAGGCDGATGNGGGNVKLSHVLPLSTGLLAVGYHTLDAQGLVNGLAAPTAAVPSWGKATVTGEDAILAKLDFSKPGATVSAGTSANTRAGAAVRVMVVAGGIRMTPTDGSGSYSVNVYSAAGRLVASTRTCRGTTVVPPSSGVAVVKVMQQGRAVSSTVRLLSH